MTFPKIIQRTVIAEPDAVDGGFFVMLDTGHVHHCDDKYAVLGFVGRSDRATSKRRKASIITTLEWRNTPAGFVLPTPEEAWAYGRKS